jgi:hypothetical protein
MEFRGKENLDYRIVTYYSYAVTISIKGNYEKRTC